MQTKQQQEALTYFEAFARDWKEKASGQKISEVNVIVQRNNFVLEVIRARSEKSSTLDVGCGTGELVHDIARMNIHATGVDFSGPMIALAEETAKRENLPDARFVCASVFDYPFENDSLDVISANGFIEYISYEQFDLFLETSFRALKKGGSLVLGSRNRLFNMFSLNRFTANEIANHHSGKLLTEAIQLAALSDPRELLRLETVPLESADKTFENTGIDVSTRFQYTPAQLVQKLDEKGFDVKELCPVHVHGVIPGFATDHKDIHCHISNLLSGISDEEKACRNKLIPFSSSFMIHATRK